MSLATLWTLSTTACFSPEAPIDGNQPAPTAGESESSTGMSTSSGPSGMSASSGSEDTKSGTTTDATTATGTSNETEPAAESSTGTPPENCGNGVIDRGEECDDGNVSDDDACSSSCEEQFFAGDATPCSTQQSEVCEFLEGSCHQTQSPAAGGAVCFWELYSDSSSSCDETPGVWTPDDAPFARQENVHIPTPGVCINFIANLTCSASDQTTCDAAGATVCYQNKDTDGVGNLGVALCAWDVSQAECNDTPGLWTSAGSTFEQVHPNSVPPGADGACISQVTNF